MNQDQYKRRLLEKEQALLVQLTRAGKRARSPSDGPVHDAGDESVEDERKDEQFREADADWRILGHVREALQRIEEGTFGTCVVDGEAIEENRLEAIPWTPYCLRHQQEREKTKALRMSTL